MRLGRGRCCAWSPPRFFDIWSLQSFVGVPFIFRHKAFCRALEALACIRIFLQCETFKFASLFPQARRPYAEMIEGRVFSRRATAADLFREMVLVDRFRG